MNNPAAYFDTLFLGETLTELVQGFSRFELHLLCYAACLLSLYEGEPSADWEYHFVSATSGLPFAQEVDEAIDDAQSLGFLDEKGNLLQLAVAGKTELEIQLSFESNQARKRYLTGAADCLLVLTPGTLREALEYDPNLSYLKNRRQSEWLLREPDRDRLYSHFAVLRRALAYEARDLSVPLITWLKYLLHIGRHDSITPTN